MQTHTFEIIPAIMPQSLEDIRNNTLLVKDDVDTVQLDIMDGKYVPERTLPFRPGAKLDIRTIEQIRDEGLPFWEEVNYELDLMVQRPEMLFETFLTFAPSRIIFHYASVHAWDTLYDIMQQFSGLIAFGLACTVFDTFEEIEKQFDEGHFSFVQFMGIEKIGYMGQEFTPRVFEKIDWFRERYPEIPIAIDGGVSMHTIRELAEHGATRFVSGSGVFHHGIPAENIEHYLHILRNDDKSFS